jgi:uncharacterized protein with von Willebrand factor type A (vWA) domain
MELFRPKNEFLNNFMHYLANYYKNLCEQLQEKINILEAGYSKAIRSGDREQMEKELLKQKALEKHKEEMSEKGYRRGTENFDVLDPDIKAMPGQKIRRMSELPGFTKSRDKHKKNIQAIARQLAELPAESPFGTDRAIETGMAPHSSNATY